MKGGDSTTTTMQINLLVSILATVPDGTPLEGLCLSMPVKLSANRACILDGTTPIPSEVLEYETLEVTQPE